MIPNGLFPGLKSVPPADRPPLVPVFFAFRIMVGIGFFMIAFGSGRRVAVVAADPVRDALVSLARGAHLVDRLRRGDLRLDRYRKRTPALGRCTASCAPPTRSRRCPAASMTTTLRLVRPRLRHRVLDGHLLHQPADRARTAGPRRRAARKRHAGAAAVCRHRRRARNPVPATITRGEPWNPIFR